MTSVMEVYLVQVTTDDREHKLWAAAMPVEDAVEAVLDVIPEGWTVSLLARAEPEEIGVLAMMKGEVRELRKA